MEATTMQNRLLALLAENPMLLLGLDLLIKSIIVLLLTLTISRLVKAISFSVRSQHFLWMIGILCLALIPLVSMMLGILDAESKTNAAVLTLSVPTADAGNSLTSPTENLSLGNLLLWLYLMPCLLLLGRMLFAVISVIGIGNRALPTSNKKALKITTEVANKLEITRRVVLLQSKEVTSPFSFGIFSPKIILPEQANTWSVSTLEDVLVHELSHIERFDWLSTLFCHFIASLYWVNPLCWVAVNRISEEAENSCDAAVLNFGKNGADYARNLLHIARRSRDGHRLLVQMMADKRILPKRVKRILENKLDTSISKKFLQMLSMVAITLLVSFGNTQIIAIEMQARIEFEPLETIKPAPVFTVLPRFTPF